MPAFYRVHKPSVLWSIRNFGEVKKVKNVRGRLLGHAKTHFVSIDDDEVLLCVSDRTRNGIRGLRQKSEGQFQK